MKAPLRAIRNLIRLLESGLADNLNDTNRRYMELIDNRADRLQAFLDGLPEYSRVGRQNTTLAKVDSEELLDSVLQQLMPAENIEVIKEGNFPSLQTQSFALQQVLQNLLSNAFKFADSETPQVKVGCKAKNEHWVEFWIEDNGQGIPQRFHQKIFQLFETLEVRDQGGGTGIGLAIVKKTIQQMRGKITVESKEGEGTLFRFSWPRTLPSFSLKKEDNQLENNNKKQSQ